MHAHAMHFIESKQPLNADGRAVPSVWDAYSPLYFFFTHHRPHTQYR